MPKMHVTRTIEMIFFYTLSFSLYPLRKFRGHTEANTVSNREMAICEPLCMQIRLFTSLRVRNNLINKYVLVNIYLSYSQEVWFHEDYADIHQSHHKQKDNWNSLNRLEEIYLLAT